MIKTKKHSYAGGQEESVKAEEYWDRFMGGPEGPNPMPYGMRRWSMVPQVWEHLRLVPNEFAVLVALYQRSPLEKGNRCMSFECGYTTLRNATQLSNDAITRALKSLIRMGLIEQYKQNGKESEYVVRLGTITSQATMYATQYFDEMNARKSAQMQSQEVAA